PPVKDGILIPHEFSPDGNALLLSATNQTGFLQLAVLEMQSLQDGKPPQPKGTPNFFGPGEGDVIEARWHKVGIYFVQNERGGTTVGFLRRPGDSWTGVATPDGVNHQLSVDPSGWNLCL